MISLFLVAVIVFLLMRLLPVDTYFGDRKDKMSDETKQAILQDLGLLDPLHVQLINYFKDLLHGDLGKSITYYAGKPVWTVIQPKISYSLRFGAASLVLSLVLGTLLGVFSTTRSRVLRAISRVYVEFYQNTPLPVQVLFMYMAGPQFLQAITGADQPVRIAPFVLGFLGVGLYHAAYISEVIRTGIEAVPRGQMEAAQSQGFTRAQAYWYIVLPQTFKIILPPLCNQALNLVKNTSVLALVAGGDLMYRSDNFVSLYGYLQGYIVCCLMYFIICFPLAMLVQWLERRSKERPRGVSLAELGLDNVEEA